MTAALVGGLALVVALLGVLVVGLLRSHAEILRALHELGVSLDPDGTHDHAHGDVLGAVPAPPLVGAEAVGRDLDVVGVTVDGAPRQVGVAGGSKKTLLAFLSSSCLTCRTFWEEFSEPDLVMPEGARLVVVTKGPEAESPSAIAELAPPHHLVVLSSSAWDTYRVPGAPYFVVVDGSTGRIVGQGSAPTWPRVSDLLRRAISDSEAGPDREADVDAALRAAGIEPGDPSLYPGSITSGGQS
jgi:hypothetical protein